MTIGRNFDEVLRVIDALQLTATHKVATPAQWRQGDDVIISIRSATRKPARSIRTGGKHPGLTCASSRARFSLLSPTGQVLGWLHRVLDRRH